MIMFTYVALLQIDETAALTARDLVRATLAPFAETDMNLVRTYHIEYQERVCLKKLLP